jgi:hypothetical protein
VFSLHEPPLFTRLASSSRVLIAGAGGGFDVYAGLPLAVGLTALGKEVVLANFSFDDLSECDDWAWPNVASVGPETDGNDLYFPERTLARWLASTNRPATVYTFPRMGVRPLRAAYHDLIEYRGIDAVVLVDGGTDILLRGDEARLGTPQEDMTSLAALAGIPDVKRLVVCLGFGIDAYHGVCASHVLENLAALGPAYLGALSIPPSSAEARAYIDAVKHAQAETPSRPSIVNAQIAAALRGEFGDVDVNHRAANLFVNPLMAVYFAVDLAGLAASVDYLPRLENTETLHEVDAAIGTYRMGIERRPWRAFPH